MNPAARPIFELVERVRRLLRLSIVGAGAGWAVGISLGALTLAVLLDFNWPLGGPGRAVAALGVIGATLAAYLWFVVRPVARPLSASQVARRIEAELPDMRNRLVSCVELLGDHASAPPSAAFADRLIRETRVRIAPFQPQQVIHWPRLQRATIAGLAAVVALGGVTLVQPARVAKAVQRLALPWADLPPLTSVGYAVTPGDAQVLRGDPLTFVARVERGAPERLRVEIRPRSGGAAVVHALAPLDERRWQFTLTGCEESFAYRVVGGGAWSKTHRVEVIDRPTVIELRTTLHYPAYLGRPAPVLGEPHVADVTGPEGSQVEVSVTVKGDVAVGELQRLDAAGAAALTALPMQPVGSNVWTGKFLLTSNGFYRAEFRNALGHANAPLQPGRFTAVPDQLPQVAIDRPGGDVSLAPTAKLPVVIAASDDFGLAEIVLLAGTNSFSLKTYPAPQTSDSVVGVLDLTALGAQVGQTIVYRAQARDRKGQLAETAAQRVHIVAPAQGADQNLARLAGQQELIADRLGDLVVAQETVRAQLAGLAMRYQPLLDKLAAAADLPLIAAPDQLAAAESLIATNKLPATAALDATELNQAEGLRRRLAELADAQQRNVAAATQLAGDLGQAAQLAAETPLLPGFVSAHMQALQQEFAAGAVTPMQGLAQALQQAAAPGALPTDPGPLGERSAQLQQDLGALSASLGELAAAARPLADDPARALAELALARQRAQARSAGRELDHLQEQLARTAAELARLQGDQEELFAQPVADAAQLAAVEDQQAALERELGPLLDAVRELQAGQRARRPRTPEFPAAPWAPEHGDYEVPPKEQDTPDPDAVELTPEQRREAYRQMLEERLRQMADEEEPLHMPALGGERPRLSERFADKQRPVERATAQLPLGLGPQAEELRGQQWQRLQELDLAQQSVGADQQALGALSQQIAQALGGNAPGGQSPGESGQAQAQTQALREAMQSAAMQSALAMAARAAQPGNGAGGPSEGGGRIMVARPATDAQLADLDVTARTVILGLQPRVREELLQGLQEEGPAVYRPYIRDYFDRLTRSQAVAP